MKHDWTWLGDGRYQCSYCLEIVEKPIDLEKYRGDCPSGGSPDWTSLQKRVKTLESLVGLQAEEIRVIKANVEPKDPW